MLDRPVSSASALSALRLAADSGEFSGAPARVLAAHRLYLVSACLLLFTPVMGSLLLTQFQLISHRILILGWGLANLLIAGLLIARLQGLARFMLCFVLPVLAAFGPLLAKLESPAARLAAQYCAPYLFASLCLAVPYLVYEPAARNWTRASNLWVLLLMLLIEPVNVQAGVGVAQAVTGMTGVPTLFALLITLMAMLMICTLSTPGPASGARPAQQALALPAPEPASPGWPAALLDQLFDPVLHVSEAGKILYANPAWMQVLGYDAAELTGRHLRELMHPDAAAQQLAQWQHPEHGCLREMPEWILAGKTGESRFVVCKRMAAGRLGAGQLLVFRDLTSLKLNELDLERKIALLKEVSFNASHKLRGPVSTLIGLLDYMAQHRPADAAGTEYIQLLQDRAQSIDNELIALNSLLEQAEDGQMQDPLLDRAAVQACRQVWIVDDDRVTRRVHEKLIQRIFTQAEIRQYAHGGAAFEDLRRDPAAAPQVIFLDLHMPSMDGHAFLKACQTLLPGLLARTRIWVVSSSTVPEAQALQSHPLVSGYLVKPLTLGKLAAGMQGWKPPVISQRA